MSYSFNAGEVFKLAIQIEENGRRFYEESQKNISSTDVRTLFADLALQEIEHKKKVRSPPGAASRRIEGPRRYGIPNTKLISTSR